MLTVEEEVKALQSEINSIILKIDSTLILDILLKISNKYLKTLEEVKNEAIQSR